MGDNQSKVNRLLEIVATGTLSGGVALMKVKQQSNNYLSIDCFVDDTQDNVDALIEALQTYKKERVNNG